MIENLAQFSDMPYFYDNIVFIYSVDSFHVKLLIGVQKAVDIAIFQTKAMYANQMVIPSRDGGKEENGLHSNLSNLGLDDRVSRPEDSIPCPPSTTRAAMEKSLPSLDSRNTSPDSLIEDICGSFVVIDDHSKSIPTDFQSWVQQSSAQLLSSVDNDSSLSTCLNRAQGLSKATNQIAYEQNLLLNSFPGKLQSDIDGGYENQEIHVSTVFMSLEPPLKRQEILNINNRKRAAYLTQKLFESL